MQDFGLTETLAFHVNPVATPARPRLLIVEDETIVAAVLEDMADFLGYDVVGSAATVGAAMIIAQREDFDVALLDVELGAGQRSFVIAELLESRGIPYLFLSGYGVDVAGHGQALSKPFVVTDLGDALNRLRRAVIAH
jgi:CheY-like chemotaxis protein